LPQILPNENEMRVYSETEDVAENLLAADESNDAMRGTGEHDAVVGIPSMDEELLVSDDGMLIDREAGYPSERSVHSNSMIKATKSLIRSSSDSGVEVSSEPGLGSNSPISVPSTRRSSRLSLYSNTSGDAHAHHRNLHSMPSSRSTSPDDVGVFKVHSTLGGFPAFRFESYRTDPKNFPKVNYAANLPSSIQDHINNQPEEVRMLSEIREVFEAMILENTADDEREAPPIVIQNDVDEEPTPPWEFWYSNKMWHGKGVPDPDLKNLKGCDCRGACNPKNKACACAQRQCQVIGDIKASEFAYDKNGRLKFPGFPIFECNNTCWCGPECSNRVCRL
jgi:histone-lysine N-methyltransferase SUV39H